MTPVAEYETALAKLHEAHTDGVRAFAKWFAEHWQQTREEWIRESAAAPPSQAWFDGRKAGVESAVDAVEFYFGEVGGGGLV